MPVDGSKRGFDCSSGDGDPQSTWTADQKAWCRRRGQFPAKPQRLFAWQFPLALPAGCWRASAATGAMACTGLGFAVAALRFGRRPQSLSYSALPVEDGLGSG
uniref:Uncharacterized protein n=1 Tax=Alexandrium monilatum TaxID=311494 RepID=A0A7S4QBW3_9DINO